jgi:hypothetical protein
MIIEFNKEIMIKVVALHYNLDYNEASQSVESFMVDYDMVDITDSGLIDLIWDYI